jgi:carbonic anhydrase
MLGDLPITDMVGASTALAAENNGHTITYTVDAGSSLTWDGVVYDLQQFHFHSESEHLVNGAPFEMEMHLVHRNDMGTEDTSDDDLLVVGAFISEGSEPNAAFDAIGWDSLPAAEGERLDDAAASFVPYDLVGNIDTAAWYQGSLTTPPCSEIVTWVLPGQLLLLDADQLDAFPAIFDANFREPQDLNGRTVNYQDAPLR